MLLMNTEDLNSLTLLGEKEKLFRDYLNSNCFEIDIDSTDHTDLEVLNESIKNNRVFLSGEFHGVEKNKSLELKFLKYFVENADVKYYLIETNYKDSLLLNKYLESGDESILVKVYEQYKGFFSFSKENYESWKELYKFNSSLSQDKRITVIGIDTTGSFKGSLEYAYSILPQKNEIPKEIKYVINGLRDIYLMTFKGKEKNDFDNYKFWIAYLISIDKYKNVYKKYFGKMFFNFYMISKNMITQSQRNLIVQKSKEIREQELYNNFLRIYSHFPKGNFYGHFGNAHISNPYNIVQSFSSRLNNNPDSPVKNKVISINTLYSKCKTIAPIDYKGKYKEFNVDLPNILHELFHKHFKYNMTLIKLNGDGTPFVFENLNKVEFLKEFTAENIQYCILIRNSEATTPINWNTI